MEPQRISKSFVYGTVAVWLGDEVTSEFTHRWCAFVRGVGSDMAAYVRKVEFHLHPSFPEPVRTVTSYPFQIEERGWGEFEIIIKVYFRDVSLKPVEMYHMLKLFELDDGGMKIVQSKPVLRETFDQFVFSSPSPAFAHLLTTAAATSSPVHSLLAARVNALEEAQLDQLQQTAEGISSEIEELHDKHRQHDREIRRG
ncbi:YEATS domain-containing protein 4 [Thecamonas trahens ATCC 50062]|uniref:YEATS domain-containing protein 4 n=1 Tax=Thecamonas trahens ATCC 50062 TaxID=461836 RepID=A0A0L0DM28_THETB|nr:YEATS domain-containing protein 4 [Thecamonas trahens ATCC 50062]KNC53320.1 YEATS domain-containing protein 4 [Thecamonas trahens ATCC 50062]|eukprot:XP_013754579.1 YEATS domain-containing protein 4 [Thecamonas trahens ATCC 50062]